MRLLLAAAVLVTFAVPLADAHIIVCTYDPIAQECEGRSINVATHGTISQAPCLCAHFAPSLAFERVLP